MLHVKGDVVSCGHTSGSREQGAGPEVSYSRRPLRGLTFSMPTLVPRGTTGIFLLRVYLRALKSCPSVRGPAPLRPHSRGDCGSLMSSELKLNNRMPCWLPLLSLPLSGQATSSPQITGRDVPQRFCFPPCPRGGLRHEFKASVTSCCVPAQSSPTASRCA